MVNQRPHLGGSLEKVLHKNILSLRMLIESRLILLRTTIPRNTPVGSDSGGCARLGGSKVSPPLRVVKEEVVVVVVLVRRHRRAVGTAVRSAVDDEVPGAVEEETGPATMRQFFSCPGLSGGDWI